MWCLWIFKYSLQCFPVIKNGVSSITFVGPVGEKNGSVNKFVNETFRMSLNRYPILVLEDRDGIGNGSFGWLKTLDSDESSGLLGLKPFLEFRVYRYRQVTNCHINYAVLLCHFLKLTRDGDLYFSFSLYQTVSLPSVGRNSVRNLHRLSEERWGRDVSIYVDEENQSKKKSSSRLTQTLKWDKEVN